MIYIAKLTNTGMLTHTLAGTRPPPPLKLEKILFFGVKS
jgi:hypothetical protein